MNARPRRGVPWRRAILVMVAASGLALSAAAATAAPGQPPATHEAKAVSAAAANTCDPTASSLRPSGPPQVTSGSFMAKVRARGYLIAGVDQSTYRFGFFNPLNNHIEGFDIDMVRAVAAAIFGNSNPDTVHFKAISDAQRIPDITNGSVDIVAHTMTITCDRLKTV
ncbi:MAG TPA: transporter substrate-binding domain-containing protein, partial [Streptosporangiaceae bacterium]|nr:transporter substrate-binding domain-containing protein [Streptosporangiaceae bacterium]